MRTVVAAVAVAVLLGAETTEAAVQSPPDFSGSWTISAPSGGQPARGGGGRMMMPPGIGQEATISQDGNTLALVRITPMGEMRAVYNLDGSESPNTMRMGTNEMEVVSRARWEGNTLVITTPIMLGGASGESRMTLSLDESGQLVVETTRSGGPGGGQTTVTTYTRG